MSDVAGAPPPPASTPSSPPPSPPVAPPQGEVAINQNPTNSSNAVGPQAPTLPAGEKPQGRPQSRQEAIQKAFAESRAKNPPQPREAKKGDNNPPEETPDEDFSLKRRPSDQPRDRGRFAARPASEAQPGAAAERPATAPERSQAAPQAYKPPPPGSPAHHYPIPRMSPRAQADWDKVPDTVRADAHRLYNEVGKAFQTYKGDHDLANTIRPYIEMARQQGTSLQRVLANHVGIEEKLREDPIGGLEVITHNLNLHTPDGQRITFRDVCWDYLNRTPEQQQLVQSRNASTAQALQLQATQQRLAALENENRRMQYAQHFHVTRGAVDQYADRHPRFDELGDLIHREIRLGFSLDEAYRRAELLRPATAAQTRNGPTAAQTRAHDRSISGAPNGGVSANGAARNGRAPPSIKESIAGAIRHVRGGL